MLGLGIALSVAKGVIDEIGGLLSKLARRSTYSENLADSRAVISDIDSYDLIDKATILLTPTATSDALVHSVKTYTGDDFLTSTWTGATGGWSVITNGVSCSGTNGTIRQNIEMTDYLGHRFRLTYTLSNVTDSTTLNAKFGGGSNVALTSTNGTHTVYLTNDATVDNFQFTSGGDWAGDITNISLVDVSSDFDFDRASSATRINSSGLVQDMQSITDPELVLNGDFEELGDELVTNGTFDTDSDWAKGVGVTISDGKAQCLNTTTYSFSLEQNSGLTVGGTYLVSYEISNYSSGDIRVRLGSNLGTTRNADGFYQEYIVAQSSLVIFQTVGTSFSGSIDNVSVQQVDPNNRWNLGTGWSIEDGVASCDGTQTSTSSLTQSNTFDTPPQTLSNTYKITFDLVVTNGSLTVSSGSLSQSYTSSGSYTLIGIPATGSGNLNFTAASNFIGTVDNVSVKDITFSTDVDLARINYDSNGDNGHILLEPTSTNLVTYSEDFSQSFWNNTNGEVISNNLVSAPDGSISAQKWKRIAGTYNMLRPTVNITGTDKTLSVFVKNISADNFYLRGSSSFYFYNFSSQTVSNSNLKAEQYPNDWIRLSTSDTNDNFKQFGIGESETDSTELNNEVYIWGAQLEALPYATSYIPTLTGSTVTRAIETLNGSGNTNLIESRQGTFYVDIAAIAPSTLAQISISLSGGSSNDRVLIYSGSGGGEWKAQFRKDNSSYVVISKSATISNQAKIAAAWASGRYVMFIDGVKATAYGTGSETESTTFDGGDLQNVQFSPAKGVSSNHFYGKVKALAVFNEALSDTELQNLTS